MVLLKVVILFRLFAVNDCSSLHDLRSHFHDMKSGEKVDEFLKKYSGVNCKKAVPYIAVAEMLQAKYAFLPTAKFFHFRSGKEKLENYISENPNDIEARYVRLLVQINAPSFIGYSDKIEEDLKILKSRIGQSGLSKEYQKVMFDKLRKLGLQV